VLSRLRVLGPAFVAMTASVLVWIALSDADPLDTLYSLNMAALASTYGYLYIGAAAGAFAAIESGLSRRHAASRLADASGARPPVVIALHRLTPVIGCFSVALIVVIVSAALRGGGPKPVAQVAAVVVAAVASLWLAIGMGAAAGRYLPFGLGPLLGMLSTYALYVPALLSGGRGPWAVVPIMDVHPAPYSLVRPGAYLLGAALLAACAAMLVSLSGPRVGNRLVPVAAAVVGLAVTIPLALVSPHVQEAVFLERAANQATACVPYRGSSLCVLDVDDRFLGTLRQGAALAWPVLQKYSIEPDRIAQVGAPGAGSAPTVEVDVRNLASGPRATAGNIIDSAVAGSCETPTIEPGTLIPWEIVLGVVLREEARLMAGESGGEAAKRLQSMPPVEREQRVRGALAAIRACQAEYA